MSARASSGSNIDPDGADNRTDVGVHLNIR